MQQGLKPMAQLGPNRTQPSLKLSLNQDAAGRS